MGNFFRNGLPMNVHFATSAHESFLKIDVIGFQEGLSVIQTQDVNASTTGPYGQHDAQEKHYPSDLTDEEWEHIASLMPLRTGKAGSWRPIFARSLVRCAILSAQGATGKCCRPIWVHGRPSIGGSAD